MKNIMFEPYKIKAVEPIKIISRDKRIEAIKKANYNIFKLKSQDILLDFLTDSGTSAMSSNQWAAINSGDESYAGSTSFQKFYDKIHDITGFKHIFPTHQGRAAERILFSCVCGEGMVVPNNVHFDTTRGNIEFQKCEALDLVIKEGRDPESLFPFKGNMDCEKLEGLLQEKGDLIPIVMITITNNAGGGQPVSMANIRQVKEICKKYNKPFFIDACRFAENAYFIKRREDGYANKTIKEISQEIFSYADGMTMSAKKDALVNIGGWLALNDDELATKLENLLILTEGFSTYGGLAGRDIEAIVVGLDEVLSEDYLESRIGMVNYLAQGFIKAGIPVIQPTGGHAVFIDAGKMLPHIGSLQYPGHALAIALYIEGGIRSVEIGTLMFGKKPDGSEIPATMDLVRLAIPRRVYTISHLDYAIEVAKYVNDNKEKLRGFEITWQPEHLRHFSSKLRILEET